MYNKFARHSDNFDVRVVDRSDSWDSELVERLETSDQCFLASTLKPTVDDGITHRLRVSASNT